MSSEKERELAIAEKARRRREDPLWTWKPEPQQQCALDDLSPILYVEGSNRSGKTELGARHLGAVLMQSYPPWFKDKDPPKGNLNGWLVVKSLPKNPKLHAWLQKLLYGEPGIDDDGKPYVKPPILPPRVTSIVRSNPTIITIIDGKRTHTITMLTSEMKSTEFGSESPDFIYVDEPTRDDIFEELKVRLISNPRCRIIYTATDATGKAGHIADLLEDDTGLVGCHKLLARKNTHLDKERLDKVSASLGEEASGVRIEGKGGRGRGGLVYPGVFNWPRDAKKHESGRRSNWLRVEEFDRLYEDWRDWPTYMVHDPGVNNPAATVGAKRAPFGDWFVHRCVYAERPGPVIPERVAEINEAFQGDRVLDRWIDPKGACIHPPTMQALVKAKTVRDLYEDAGIRFRYGPDSQDSMGRRERALECIQWIDPSGSRPMMWFVDTGGGMEGLKKELRRYKWTQVLNARGETWNNQFATARKWDHAMYCIETLCVLASLGECPYIPKSPIKEEERRLTQARRNGVELWKIVERKMGRGEKRERVRM